jgi:hypothetical protein
MNRVDSTYVTIDYYIDGNWKARDTADFTGKPMNLIIDLQTEGSSGTAYFNDSYLTGGSIEIGYTAPDSSGPGNGTYKLIARNSGKAMDVWYAATANGSTIAQCSYNGGANQKWVVTDTGNGNYKIIGVQSGKALDIYNGNTGDGTTVELWDYNGNSNQTFKFAATDSGNYRITPNNATGSCLDVYYASTSDGADVKLCKWNGGANQQWSFRAP